ncbi:MAG: DNA polymerase III subunit delta [Oscillospiraceae bacterium]|nr:DNA polymerase III subunit delta [Oscillospiraceae bacterium]
MRLNEQRLGEDIKAGKLARVYLLYGDEDFLIRMYTDKLTRLAVADEEREMNLVRYFLAAGSSKDVKEDLPPKISELSDFVEGVPFFAERKCVVLKNLDTDLLDKDEFEGYIALLNDIPDTSTVIITRENTEEDAKKFKEKLEKAKMRKLIETVDVNGIVCELNKFPTERLMGMAISKCSRAGCELSEENARFLAERVGGSLSLLQTETEKLCAYCNGRQNGEIMRKDIEALVPKLIENKVYEIAKELFYGRFSRALELLDDVFALRFDPTRIMQALSGHFVDLYFAALGKQAKKSYSAAANELNYKGRSFVMKNAYGVAGTVPERRLADWLAILYDTNKRFNSSAEDKKRILERAIVEIATVN